MTNLNEQIRTLQKTGEYRFEGMTREESRNAATNLAKKAKAFDRKYGVECNYRIARDAFGYYKAVVIND